MQGREILDVDGICGGCNLQWAWTSGYLAGEKERQMLRISQLKLPGYAYGRGFEEKDCVHTLMCRTSGTESYEIIKQSLDARKKPDCSMSILWM